MTVAREVGVTASRTIVERTFHEAGYGRYSPRSKPNLTLEMHQKRCRWYLDYAYWGFILGWDLVIYTDETSVKLGENRGKIHVTQTKAAHAERIAVLLAERTAHIRVVSHPGYFNFSPCQRSTRGGIDWYRYQKCVLEPLLLPAYHEFAAPHQDRTVYLM